MYKIIMKSCFIYIFIILFLFLIHSPKSFAGAPPFDCDLAFCDNQTACNDPGTCDNCEWCLGEDACKDFGSTCQKGDCCEAHDGQGCIDTTCEDLVCNTTDFEFCCNSPWNSDCVEKAQELCGDLCQSDCCIEHEGSGCDNLECQITVCDEDLDCCEGLSWDSICVGEAEDLCGDLCTTENPPPTSITRNFSQVGGIANSTTSTDWCCSFFANVCAPCGNPALGYSYQMPNACDSAILYENLWVRCQNGNCSGLTTGKYEISLCHFDSQDPSSGGGETCGDPCTIDASNNRCNADIGTGPVPEGEMVYIRIHPEESPDAPLKALWSALVEDCSGQGGPAPIDCPASEDSCCSEHSGVGCNDCTCQMDVCDFDSYCCEVEWDDICADEAINGFGGDDDLAGCDVCSPM